MNIMFLIFSFNTGGIERLLIDMCNNMLDKGEVISLCIINDDYDNNLLSELSKQVKVFKLGRKVGNKTYFNYMQKLAALVKKEQIDILHCQGINCVLFSYFAKIELPQMRILNTVHDVGNYPSYSKIKLLLQNFILDETIAISHAVETEVKKRTKDASRIEIIHNAIDIGKFELNQKVFDEQEIVIGNVARFFPRKKGQDVLVKAVQKIVESQNYNIRCIFAGEVFKGQQLEFDSLQKYIKDNHLKEVFDFMGNVDDVPEFLGDIDIFALPSKYEGFGIAMIEALAKGIPVVVSDIDGPREIFEMANKEGVFIGYIAKCGDVDDFSQKILKCINSYNRLDKKEIRDFIVKHFSIDQMVDKHLQLYRKLKEKSA